jgi:hypothetical protein
MTNEQIKQLVAYLQNRAKNNPANVQTNAQATSGSSGGLGSLGTALAKQGAKKGLQYGWKEWGSPLWDKYVSPLYTEAAAEGGADVAGLSGAGEAGAGGSALASEGVAGVGVGGWAALAAPLIMTWMKHQAGSGINEPIRKQYETKGAGKMLSEMIEGKTVNPNESYKYGLKPKYIPDWLDPSGYREEGGGAARGTWTVDPRGHSPQELYDAMHRYGTGHDQTGGVGNSGYSDQQIDDMFGTQKEGLAKLLGVNSLPDWTNRRYDDKWEPGQENPWAVNDPNVKLDKDWELLPQEEKDNYTTQAYTNSNDPMKAKWYYDRDKQKKELEKLLGYSFDIPNMAL